jgi:serine/threonine protein phosphatase PrpC
MVDESNDEVSPLDREVLVEQELRRPEAQPFAGGTVVFFSVPCPGEQRPNEDGLALIRLDERSGALAVADGLGGQPAGAKAAKIALHSLAESLNRAHSEGTYLREAILDAIERANRKVQELGVGAGTTLAVVEIRDRTARAYHVGDSEVLVVGQRGKIRFQTVSHSPVGYGIEAGLIDRREALEHADRHLLSNLVGSPEMRIEIGPLIKLRPRDVVLLATDGLHDNLHAHEIVETIRRGSLQKAANALARVGAGRMGRPGDDGPSKPDDLSFILYRRSIR